MENTRNANKALKQKYPLRPVTLFRFDARTPERRGAYLSECYRPPCSIGVFAAICGLCKNANIFPLILNCLKINTGASQMKNEKLPDRGGRKKNRIIANIYRNVFP